MRGCIFCKMKDAKFDNHTNTCIRLSHGPTYLKLALAWEKTTWTETRTTSRPSAQQRKGAFVHRAELDADQVLRLQRVATDPKGVEGEGGEQRADGTHVLRKNLLSIDQTGIFCHKQRCSSYLITSFASG